MRLELVVVVGLLVSCSTEVKVDKVQIGTHPAETIESDEPQCPEGHSDGIIPIVYGEPSEETFAAPDSGLVAIGGCELSDESGDWWCPKHELEF